MQKRVRQAAILGVLCAFAWLAQSNADAREYGLRTLHSFCAQLNCTDGGNYYSASPLTRDANGGLYGTAQYGGTHGNGVAFELFQEPGKRKWRFKVLYDFCAKTGCTDGTAPAQSPLIIDVQGNLFGVTPGGGSADSGTMFELTPSRTGKYWVLHTLYNFCGKKSGCPDGQSPTALTYQGATTGQPYDDVSPLYGVTGSGGKHQGGVAFSMTAVGDRWEEQKLFQFCQAQGCTDGRYPAQITVDPSGDLVGIASIPNQQILFRLAPVVGQAKWAETILYTFCSLANCGDGQYPSGPPVVDTSGNIFGEAEQGGAGQQCPYSGGCGVIYKIGPDNTETVLYNFCSQKNCKDGIFPEGPLTMDVSGSLYGTTINGGQYQNVNGGGGTVFVVSSSGLQTTLRSFCDQANCPDGLYPYGGVAFNSAGEVFGMTAQGGVSNKGSAFELRP